MHELKPWPKLKRSSRIPSVVSRGELHSIPLTTLGKCAEKITHWERTFFRTRMHSSRMRIGRSLTVCCSLLGGRGSAPGGGVCSLGGVCSRGGVVCSRGCLVCSRGDIPACTEADTLPPPVDRILDTHLWKYYLGPTSLRPVININRVFPKLPTTQNRYIYANHFFASISFVEFQLEHWMKGGGGEGLFSCDDNSAPFCRLIHNHCNYTGPHL